MRRPIALLAAGLLAAGFALALAIAVPMTAVPAAAAPATAKCVGLVVDFGGGSVQSTCVPFTNGMTGAQVLSAAKHKVTNKGAFLCRIDAHPSKCASDNTHYWSYYHRAPGGRKWAFSNSGATTYHVKPGETEGWAFVNGTKTREPKAVPYAQLQAMSTPTPTPTASASASKSESASKSASASPSAAADSDDGGGTPWGLIIGIVAVVVIVGAAVARLVARRS